MQAVILLVAVASACLAQGAAQPNYEYSCIHYCENVRYGNKETFCCRMAKVSTQSPYVPPPPPPRYLELACPPVRSSCPRSGPNSPPLACNSDDKCSFGNKCCYDTCLDMQVCKKGVQPRNRRSASNESGPSASGEIKSLAYAIVDGSSVAVTLVNASDKSLDLFNVNGKVVDVVAGDYLLEVEESTLAKVQNTEDGHLVTDETGAVLMDKNGFPLSVQPATSIERSKLIAYCIVNGDGKKVTLVNSNGERVQAYSLDGRRVTLSEGSYEIEVEPYCIVSIEKTADGAFIVVQHGSALTDENGDLLEALPSESRARVTLNQYIIANGRGLAINLLTKDGFPTNIFDVDGNRLVVKPAEKNLIVNYSELTAKLVDNVMVLTTSSGEKLVDERKMAVTIKPATKTSRRKRDVHSYSIKDSSNVTISLVDQSDVACSLVFENGEPFPAAPGDKVMKIAYSTLVVVQSEDGLRIKSEDGVLIVDEHGKALSISLKECTSGNHTREIRDVSGNAVTLVGPGNTPVDATSDGELVEVKEGVVKILINTNTVRIVETADGGEGLEDALGNPILDTNGKNLQVMTERNKASKVVTYILVDGEDNEVTLTTQDGAPVTVLDEEDNKVVVLEGDGKVSVATSETARRKRSTNKVVLVDSSGVEVSDGKGTPLKLQEVAQRQKNAPRNFVLVDGEGNSITLLNLEEGPVRILDKNGEKIHVGKGEKTLHIEANSLTAVPGKAGSNVQTLVDENGNAVFSDSGPVKLVPTKQDDIQQADNVMAVAEAFVELNFNLKHLSTIIQENKVGAEGSSTKTFSSVFQEVGLFARLAGQLQKKCAQKLKNILQGQDSASEALNLLQEMDLSGN